MENKKYTYIIVHKRSSNTLYNHLDLGRDSWGLHTLSTAWYTMTMWLHSYITLVPSGHNYKSYWFNNVPLHISTSKGTSSGEFPSTNLLYKRDKYIRMFIVMWCFMQHTTPVIILLRFDTLWRSIEQVARPEFPQTLSKWNGVWPQTPQKVM
jgi:hypothetical protein